MAEPRSISQARKMGKDYFIGKDGKRKAAVTKEELKKSGLSLRDYLNKQQGKTRRTTAKVASRPKPAPRAKVPAPAPKAQVSTPKRKTPAILKESPGADLSAPKAEATTPRRKTAKDILGTREKSRAARRARQEAKTQKDTSMTPEQKLKGQIGISAATAALIGPAAIPILMRVATKHGSAFARSLGNKVKNLSNKQQEDIMKEVARSNLSKRDMNIALRNAETPKDIRTEVARQKSAESGKRAPGEKPFRQTTERKGQQARNRQRRRETRRQQELKKMNEELPPIPRFTKAELQKRRQRFSNVRKKVGGNLKAVDTQNNPGLAKLPTKVRNRMGYAKSGGKVVSRKGGGMVGSGNDLVASMYD